MSLIDDPLFGSENGALKFAFNFVHGAIKVGTLGSLVGGAKVGRGLAGLDGAGQAGLIRAELGKMPPVRRAILTARYALPSVPCKCQAPCCRGYRENPEWSGAVDEIAEYVLRQGATGTISHFRFRRALVSRYFGVRVSFVDMAAQCGVNRDTASDQHKNVSELLKKEERLARYEVEGLFKAAGLVE